ncbi:5-oxoprolinase subunit PxpB [Paraburkholderia caledonica]|uniref:KipI family sensor histidine kinase inhibitor n=1 Tax=Paraburkholderia caledonica TaxID=134536 RepID=A0AB73IQC8_9BURK|nr:KipI family sensor histidine kinase inhibitor [Paraburkholderia caledonica]
MSTIERAAVTTACRLHHSSEGTLIVEVQSDDRVAANHVAREIAARIAAANHPFIYDIVPAMTTVGVHYDPHRVDLGAGDRLPYQVVEDAIGLLVDADGDAPTDQSRVVEIPVCYGGEYGPDLAEVAQACGLTEDEAARLHASAPVDVMMIGFAPGHPYIGLLDDKLTPPRRATPRTAVPPGSVGLANRQSVIYPVTLPSGWNLIGRTPLQMFDPSRAEPCLLQAGDKVRFVPIDPAEFDALNQHAGAAQ